MKAEIINNVKPGSTSYATVSGVTVQQAETTGLRAKQVGSDVEIAYTNKSEYGKIIDMVDSVNAQPQQESGDSERYIERTDVANVRGLAHGKSWVADLYTIDKYSLDPSWEGELICYVYK